VTALLSATSETALNNAFIEPKDDSEHYKSTDSLFDFSHSVSTGTDSSVLAFPPSALDDRLLSVLHNIISLQFFIEFCLCEFSVENILFWIEVEVFRTIRAPQDRQLFAEYIYLTYLSGAHAPLKLNVSDEIVMDIPWPVGESPDPSLFDEVQDHTYAIMKGHSYARYEASEIFQKFIEFKESGEIYCSFFSSCGYL
jgi:hypothetical protein